MNGFNAICVFLEEARYFNALIAAVEAGTFLKA